MSKAADLIKDVTKALIKGRECKELLREFVGNRKNYLLTREDHINGVRYRHCNLCGNEWLRTQRDNHTIECLITRIQQALKEE